LFKIDKEAVRQITVVLVDQEAALRSKSRLVVNNNK
jgi:hypothetical protein